MGSGQRGGGPKPPPLSHLRLRELPFHLREERADSKLAEGSPAGQAVPRGQAAWSCEARHSQGCLAPPQRWIPLIYTAALRTLSAG